MIQFEKHADDRETIIQILKSTFIQTNISMELYNDNM